MWISKQRYDELLQSVFQSAQIQSVDIARAKVLEEQNRVLQVQLDFMRLRVNQMEKERAQLFEKVTGIQIPVPEIVPAREVANLYGELPDFEDMGNKKAEELGVEHSSDWFIGDQVR